MFSVIKTLGSSFMKDCVKSLNFTSRPCTFSTYRNSILKPAIQTDYSSKFIMPQNFNPRTLLQVVDSNLCLSRNVTKFSLKTGKRKSVYAVLNRFYRLNCGLWIRRRAGSHKRLWKKNCATKYNLLQHVVCTRTQCIMLDKMITDHHKKPKYYIDDPFEPYHKRNGLDWVLPRRKR